MNEDPGERAINTTHMLAVDAVHQAKSGLRGTLMDAAPTAYVLWRRFLRYDPVTPHGYAGPAGPVVGMHTFGMSVPIKAASEYFGLTPAHVVEAAKRAIRRSH